MNIRIRTSAIVATLALMGVACSGPADRIEVGSKDVPVDIVLGAPRQIVPAQPPGSDPIGGFPGFISPPIPRPEPGAPPPPAPPPKPCPIADPLSAAKLVAREAAPIPPREGTYTYRNKGTLKVGAGAATAYPPAQLRTVRNIRTTGEGSYEFDVVAVLAGAATTTTYRVLNTGLTPDRGVYIVAIVTERADGRTEAFTPDQPLLLMPFPSPEYGTNLEDEVDRQRGSGYRSSGTDPLSQTTLVVEAKIVGKARANACGEWVDAFDVEVTMGKIVGPTKNIDFTGHYLVATQYGGLIVEDNLTFAGTDNLEPIESRNRATINSVPREPR